MRGLADKVVVVAGGGSGIGAETALRLGAEGVAVVVGDLDGDRAAAVASEVRDAGGQARGVQFDIAEDDSVAALIDTAITEFGGLDGLHANAADLSHGNIGRDTDALDLPLEVFDRTLAVNVRGHLLCTRHALPHLLERGGGALVYSSSVAGHMGGGTRPSYAVSKAGINALVRHVASRWGSEGIRANAVAPGPVITPAMEAAGESEFHRQIRNDVRSPRLGRPADIAAMVAFLLSDDGEWVNGQVVNVDGGYGLRA